MITSTGFAITGGFSRLPKGVDFANMPEPILIKMHTEETKLSSNPGHVRKIARILMKVILFVLLFALLLFLFILTPPAQKIATNKVENYLQKKLNTKVEIGSISVGLTGWINLKDVYVEDQTKDTLIAGGNIQANISLAKLFSNEVEVKEVTP